MKSEVTIVSCYYPLECSKHSIENYKKWIPNFLTYIDSPIVMFSEGETYDWLCELRAKANLSHRFFPIRKAFDALEFSSPEWVEIWDHQNSLGYWKDQRFQEVYRIWANKPYFVKQAMEKNPFESQYFVWCDAGCWRNEDTAKTFGHDWPSTKAFQPKKLTILTIESLYPYLEKLGSPEIQSLDDIVVKIPTSLRMTVGGTILGGDKEAWDVWGFVFRKTLESFVKHNIFAGDDQSVITSTLLWLVKFKPEYGPFIVDDPVGKGFYLIRNGKRLDDRWYVLQILLSHEFAHLLK
jgi:hypothetical protein